MSYLLVHKETRIIANHDCLVGSHDSSLANRITYTNTHIKRNLNGTKLLQAISHLICCWQSHGFGYCDKSNNARSCKPTTLSNRCLRHLLVFRFSRISCLTSFKDSRSLTNSSCPISEADITSQRHCQFEILEIYKVL